MEDGMGFAPADVAAIPVHHLAQRRLRLGPFGSGRDLVKFLCIATVGATVAAVTSAVVWLPFLAIGATIALVRVEGQTIDDYALGYCRFRWRSAVASRGAEGAPPAGRSSGTSSGNSPFSIRAGGIPIAYLPPPELEHLFQEWRSTLAAFDHPVGCRMRGELFSSLPFLPVSTEARGIERAALDSYRELVRALLHERYRRAVDLTVWNDRSDRESDRIGVQTQIEEVVGALERLGIPARAISLAGGRRRPTPGVVP
jgi:hypothetical protein